MSTKNLAERLPLSAKLVVRLWIIMMVLILLSVGFMWLVQIFFFERNYLDSSLAELENRLEPMMEELQTVDLAEDESLLRYLSKSTGGKTMLVSPELGFIALYSYGYPVELDVEQHFGTTEPAPEEEDTTWYRTTIREEYQQVLLGQRYQKAFTDENGVIALEIGIPVRYQGQEAYLIFYHTLEELDAVLTINRRQLVILSLLLTILAACLAALFSRQFTRPIQAIKDTVQQLTQGQLEAKPELKRQGELGQLADSVEELGQELQRVDVLRKEVIANVSHELRSPLALISGYSEMVRDISGQDEAMRREHLDLILKEARRMDEMVNDILDYSQFQAGYMSLKQDCYNLYEIAESEVYHCRQSAAEFQIKITLESVGQEYPVCLDALKISQVLRNLLYNAINHTEDGGSVTVRLQEQADGGLRVAVENPGEPIPEAERALIWERYQRSQHQSGRRQGTGLGLSIVSNILTAHGMEFGVDCREGLTVFWFVCPLLAAN